jgi:hypothetical protein
VSELSTPAPDPAPATPDTSRAGTLSLWTGVLGAPAAWLLKFQLMYIIVPWACPVPHRIIYIHLLSLLVLALSAAAGYLSWREWTRAGVHLPSGEDGSPVTRTRFLAAVGLMTSSLFFLLSLGQGIAALMLNPCWT